MVRGGGRGREGGWRNYWRATHEGKRARGGAPRRNTPRDLSTSLGAGDRQTKVVVPLETEYVHGFLIPPVSSKSIPSLSCSLGQPLPLCPSDGRFARSPSLHSSITGSRMEGRPSPRIFRSRGKIYFGVQFRGTPIFDHRTFRKFFECQNSPSLSLFSFFRFREREMVDNCRTYLYSVDASKIIFFPWIWKWNFLIIKDQVSSRRKEI